MPPKWSTRKWRTSFWKSPVAARLPPRRAAGAHNHRSMDAFRTIRSGPAITDVAGELASRIQLARLTSRYGWAREYCHGKTVLEVACGTGQGLGLLSSVGQRVVGGDYSAENLAVARATYGSRAPLVRFDA